MKNALRLAVFAAVLAIAAPAAAAVINSSFNVTATVAKTCEFQAAAVTDLAFGAYDPLNAAEVTANTSFQLRCTRLTPVTIDLGNGGASYSAGLTQRQMDDGAGNFLAYDLDQVGSPWTAPWGTTAGGTALAVTPASNGWLSYTVYGRIRAGEAPTTGNYSDNVTITITY
jgi:spore coat protein U-like protein